MRRAARATRDPAAADRAGSAGRPSAAHEAGPRGRARACSSPTRHGSTELGIDRLDAHVDEADLGAQVASSRVTTEIDGEIGSSSRRGSRYRPPRIPGLEAAHVNATPRGMTRLVDGARRRAEARRRGRGGADRHRDAPRRSRSPVTTSPRSTCSTGRSTGSTIRSPRSRAPRSPTTGARFVGGAELTELVAVGEDGQATVCYKGGSLAADVVVAATGGRPSRRPGWTSRRRSCRSASVPICASPVSSASTRWAI